MSSACSVIGFAAAAGADHGQLGGDIALVSALTVKTGMGQNLDYIIIGNIMLLIPGIPFVNSMRDIFVGDTITGLLNAFEAVCALAIAAGSRSCSCSWGAVRV